MVRLFRFLSRFAFAIIGVLAVLCVVVIMAVEIFKLDLPSITIHAVSAYSEGKESISSPFGRIKVDTSDQPDGLHLSIECVACDISSSHLAPTPFRPESGSIIGVMKDKRFKGTLALNGIHASLDATWEGFSGSGEFILPLTDIAALYHAARQLVPEEARAAIGGKIEGKGRFRWPSMELLFEPKLESFTVDGLIDPAKYGSGQFEYIGKDGSGKEVTLRGGEGTPTWKSLAEIGPLVPRAVVAAEDIGFYSHAGFDLEEMKEASENNFSAGRLKRGGSTITQQLAKNLFLTPERTYARKLRELLYTVELERDLSKQRIMELYLNVVEWGPDIHGIGAAAATYFGKSPIDLRPEEAAWLAGILRGPVGAHKRQFMRQRSERWRVDLVLRRMKLTESELREALERPVVFARLARPR